MIEEKAFIEHAQFGSNFYGTSVKAVKDVAEEGHVCVLDIEMEVRIRPVSKPAFKCVQLTRVRTTYRESNKSRRLISTHASSSFPHPRLRSWRRDCEDERRIRRRTFKRDWTRQRRRWSLQNRRIRTA